MSTNHFCHYCSTMIHFIFSVNSLIFSLFSLDHSASLHVQADPVLSLHAIALPVSFSVAIRQTACPTAGILLSANIKIVQSLFVFSLKDLYISITY